MLRSGGKSDGEKLGASGRSSAFSRVDFAQDKLWRRPERALSFRDCFEPALVVRGNGDQTLTILGEAEVDDLAERPSGFRSV